MLFEKYKEKKIVIYGAGIIARAAIFALKNQIGIENMKLIGCAVSDKNVNVSEIDGVKVHSIEEIAQKHKDAKVLLAVREKYIDDIILVLKKYDMIDYERVSFEECISIIEKKWLENSDRYTKILYKYCKNDNLSDEEYLMFLSKQLKSDVLSFEVNFADHCNLNCQCCNHFSPIASEKFIDKTQYKKDLQRLYELFGDKIGRVMMLGGEPLLNPDIISLIQLTRRILPTTTLYLFTNGLLFPKMGIDFWDACKKNNISIKVTEYPLKFDYKYWFAFAIEHGVDMTNENPEAVKTTYKLPIKEKGGLDAYRNYVKCYHANQCIVLRDGRLYTCPIAAWDDYLNMYFHKSFPEKEENSIDIYKAQSADIILKFLRHPIKMCEYCDIYNYEYNIPWKVSLKEENEWIDVK